MASATAPPTPVSISSNTKVGAEPRSASTTLSASRKRASSPPEATFISGPARVPGLVCTQNSTRSMPLRAGRGGIAGDLGREFRPLQLERLEFAVDRLVELRRRPSARACRQVCRPPRDSRLSASRAAASSAFKPVRAGIDQRDVGFVARRQRRQFVDRHVVFAAPRRAARTAAPRCVRVRPDRNRRCAAPARDGCGLPPAR